ncbi:CiaD-like domain-containing protein [Helicobacter felis]|uniref:Campylobacter invasion antigen D C-terminal domain-containing protein n=2 Tax=Helicobacter felis TaxID=214 RepID=E7ACD2_HELFC|nr:hypothetical protein [Helicobacter felis]CBY83019.1 Putative hypothetical protein [Helicobacter felis ATCC 49179]
MELKNIIAQTLDEIGQKDPKPKTATEAKPSVCMSQEEQAFLRDLEQKTLVLFEGLRAHQIKDLPTKLDLVLNYLQYQLFVVQERLKVYQQD